MTRRVLTVPSDQVEVQLDGLTFGQPTTKKPVSAVPEIPQSLESLAGILRGESKILTLEGGPNLTKPRVLEAYGHDITLLGRRMDELDACVRQAIRCSVVFGGDRKLSEKERESRAEKLWTELHKQIPPVAYEHILKLPYTLAAQPPEAILADLKRQFQQVLAETLQRVALRMKSLVDQELIGLVSWAGEDACCYHYFCHEHREAVTNEQTRIEDRATGRVFGGREKRTLRDRTVREGQYLVRHVHHLVDAALHDLDDYARPMPERVGQFLDSVPSHVRHLFQIVDGQMTMNEIIAKKVGERTRVETETIAVYRYDPAVTLGDYVLVGWDDPEVQEEQKRLRQERRQKMKKSLQTTGQSLLWVIGAVLTLVGILWALDTYTARQEARTQQAKDRYSEHVLKYSDNVLEAKVGDLIQLGNLTHVAFGGLSRDTKGNLTGGMTLLVGRGGATHPVDLHTVPESSAYYGSVDLDATFGISATLRVIEATPYTLRYVVTKNE